MSYEDTSFLINDTLVDKNITALIANKLISYNKPILILNEIVDDENQQVLWSGSARNPGSKGFNDFQSFIKNSGFADFAEGHSNAFGVQFTDDNLTKFIEYSNEKLKTFDFTPAIPIDAVLYANLIDDYYADLVELCELDYIWGKGVEEPIFYIKDFNIGAKDSDTWAGSLVLTACDIVLDGLGTGIQTGGVRIEGDPAGTGLYFYNVSDASKSYIEIFRDNIPELVVVELDNYVNNFILSNKL